MKRLSVFGFRLSVVGRFASVVAITGLISACASQNGNPDAYGHIEATAITISAETSGVVLAAFAVGLNAAAVARYRKVSG